VGSPIEDPEENEAMMRLIPAAIAVLLGVGILGFSLSVVAEENDDEPDVAKIAALVKEATVTLVQAVKTAEEKAGGRAVVAGLEMDDGVLMYEVFVLVTGEKAKVVEVEVNAKTGKVIDVETVGDDDDEEGEDEDEDDEEDDDEDEDEDD
jgi:hypothetical protein